MRFGSWKPTSGQVCPNPPRIIRAERQAYFENCALYSGGVILELAETPALAPKKDSRNDSKNL